MKKEIIEIRYPAGELAQNQQFYRVGDSCKSIKEVYKFGEMAKIEFYEIELNDGTFEEIKASEVVCRFKKIKEAIDDLPM